MSLQAWYPFNGNLENLGLGDLDLAVQTSPTYTAGKVTGQALSYGQFAWTAGQSAKILNNKALSISFWLKATSSSSAGGGALFGQSYPNRRFCIFTYPNYTDLHLDWRYDDAGNMFVGSVESGFFTLNQWTHCAITFEAPNTLKIYKNGSLLKTYTGNGTMNISNFAYATDLSFGLANRCINDFRVYDHCLSPKEVKEISKGLMLHYPLSSPYDIGFANKYSGITAEGLTNAKTNAFAVSKLTNERGYNYKFVYTGTSGNAWCNMEFPVFEFTPNKTYQYSCKIRLHKYSTNINFEMRGARCNNDWGRPSVALFNNIPIDEQWHTLSISVTVPATFDLSGTLKTAAPCIEFWTGNLNSNGTVYEMDFDLKDVQVVECDGPVEFIENEFLDNTIYDTSGYKNNGVQVIKNSIKLSSDSPRGENCYIFNGTNSGIYKIPTCLSSTSSDFTISFWYKPTVVSNGAILNCRNTIGEGVSIFWVDQYLRFDTGLNSQWVTGKTLSLNTWYHIVFTRNSSYKKLYVNGQLYGSFTTIGYLTTLGKYMSVGISSSDDVNTVTTLPNPLPGNLSDFRIYSTCLSDSDIQELYNKPISIDNNGNLFAQEIIEEVSSASKFEKSGIVKAEDVSFAPIQDMKIKTLNDGSVWARILHHNNKSGTVVFTSSNVMNIQSINLYSRLYLLENFRDSNGTFEFMAIQPELSDKIYRWKQTNNPTKSGSISGYVNVQNGLGGLVYGPASQTLMSVSGTTNNWWCAVGCYINYNNGLPGFDQKIVNQTLDFYVRIDTLPKNNKFNIYNKFIECEDIIEN